jgi:hypothetical protein
MKVLCSVPECALLSKGSAGWIPRGKLDLLRLRIKTIAPKASATINTTSKIEQPAVAPAFNLELLMDDVEDGIGVVWGPGVVEVLGEVLEAILMVVLVAGAAMSRKIVEAELV